MDIKKCLPFALALVFFVTPTLFGANLWQNDFADNSIDGAYETPDGGNGIGPPEWVEEDGVVKQIEPEPGDPTYLAVELDEDIGFAGQLVRIRFDELMGLPQSVRRKSSQLPGVDSRNSA